jgi:hypothetical protein
MGLILVGGIFFVLKISDKHAVKENGAKPETNLKLLKVAIVFLLAVVGWITIGQALFPNQ